MNFLDFPLDEVFVAVILTIEFLTFDAAFELVRIWRRYFSMYWKLLLAIWFALVPLGRKTARQFARKQMRGMNKKMNREILAGKPVWQRFLLKITESAWLKVFWSIIIICMAWHILLVPESCCLCQEKKWHGNVCSGDTNFLVATAQAALLGVVIPVVATLGNQNDVAFSDHLRELLHRYSGLHIFVINGTLLLIVLASAEAFGTATGAYHLGLLVWFGMNLLLALRIIAVHLNRSDFSAFLAQEYRANVEKNISQIGMAQWGERFDD